MVCPSSCRQCGHCRCRRSAQCAAQSRLRADGLGSEPTGPILNRRSCGGACTFRAAIETQIEIDYQLSQAGRGLKYSSDPTLLIKEPATTDSEIIKGAGNALVVTEKGDAKLLEIGGTASAAVIEYVRTFESSHWRACTAIARMLTG